MALREGDIVWIWRRGRSLLLTPLRARVAGPHARRLVLMDAPDDIDGDEDRCRVPVVMGTTGYDRCEHGDPIVIDLMDLHPTWDSTDWSRRGSGCTVAKSRSAATQAAKRYLLRVAGVAEANAKRLRAAAARFFTR